LIKLSFKHIKGVSTPSNALRFLSPNTPKNHMMYNHGILLLTFLPKNPVKLKMVPNGIRSNPRKVPLLFLPIMATYRLNPIKKKLDYKTRDIRKIKIV